MSWNSLLQLNQTETETESQLESLRDDSRTMRVFFYFMKY